MNTKTPLPSLAEVKDGIDTLLAVEKWDLYKMKRSPRLFKKRLDALFFRNLKVLPHIVYLTNELSVPKRFYRLRKQTRSFNESLISEYSYPPNELVKSVQRANIPYHPVFYCSDNPITAIQETLKGEAKNTDIFYMSEWSVRENVKLNVFPFLFDNVDPHNPYKTMSDYNRIRLFEELGEYSIDEKNAMLEILKFLSNLFIYEDTYVVSSYLAYNYLYAQHEYRPDIFVYPSVRMAKKTVNFAFHPNCVAEKLQLKRVFKLQLPNYDKLNKRYNLRVTWLAHNVDGILHWREADQDTETGKAVREELKNTFGPNS